MKVTFLVAAVDNGGGIRVLAQYAHGLMERGHEIKVVCPAPIPYGRMNKIKNSLFSHSGPVPANHFTRLGVPVTMLERNRPIRYSDVPDADVIIATWWETSKWMSVFPDAKGKKLHFVQGYEIWNDCKEEVEETLRLPIEKLTISSWLVLKLSELGLHAPDVIPNGVEHDLFYSCERDPPQIPTIGFVYTDNPRKGGDIAFEAIRIAAKERKNVNVIVFGHSAPPESDCDLANLTVIVSPEQHELRDIYSSCTTWLFPSREEGFGLPILEALACGTPVIACRSGAAPEILQNGGGTLLESFSPEEMAAEIVRYVDMSQDEWRKISGSAVAVARTFDWQIATDKFEKKLLDLIKLD